jgi:mitogen-activated protein kinase kinase kinase 11
MFTLATHTLLFCVVQSAEETGDVGWWLGRINHRVGVFPLNYVLELTRSEQRALSTSDSPLFEIPYEAITIEKMLGAGGFGHVYKGVYQDSCVAVKKLTLSSINGSELKAKAEELRAEGELLLLCSHKNICRVVGACTVHPNLCLVMEYAAG